MPWGHRDVVVGEVVEDLGLFQVQTPIGSVLCPLSLHCVVIQEEILLVASFHVVTQEQFVLQGTFHSCMNWKALDNLLNLFNGAGATHVEAVVDLLGVVEGPHGKRILLIDELELVLQQGRLLLLTLLTLEGVVVALHSEIGYF